MSDDDKPRTEDPDRAAILARRQHFIALALTGLATTACASTNDDGSNKGEDAGKGPRPEAPPEPCLKVMPADETGTSSTTTTAEGGETGGGETGGETSGGETEGETGAPPQPCLKVAPPPEPCLKKAPPQPCLKKAAPKPCLNVAPTD
ncbi:hypothetical protein ACNOYE_35935 [Nannocystaceae bacterium ST9]